LFYLIGGALRTAGTTDQFTAAARLQFEAGLPLVPPYNHHTTTI
jgi:hypothetical protein